MRSHPKKLAHGQLPLEGSISLQVSKKSCRFWDVSAKTHQIHPPKTKINGLSSPENKTLEPEVSDGFQVQNLPFPQVHFQLPCSFWGGVRIFPSKSSFQDPSCKALWGWPAACRNRSDRSYPLEWKREWNPPPSSGLVVKPTPICKKNMRKSKWIIFGNWKF